MTASKPWTKQFELDFWTAYEDKYYLDMVFDKYKLFDVDSYFDEKVDLAVDVGGGKFGGALYFFGKANRKVLVDMLAEDYLQMEHTIPDDVTAIGSDFRNLPLEDNSVDALFAWSVLDHSLSKEHFCEGQAELVRVLKPKGLFFFEQLLRNEPYEGHTIVVSEDEVMNGFGGLVKLKTMSPDRFYAVYTKEE